MGKVIFGHLFYAERIRCETKLSAVGVKTVSRCIGPRRGRASVQFRNDPMTFVVSENIKFPFFLGSLRGRAYWGTSTIDGFEQKKKPEFRIA